MKSHLFTDTQDFDSQWTCPPDKISVCLRLDKDFYLGLCRRAANEGLTTGQYMEQTVRAWEALAGNAPNSTPGIKPPLGGSAGPEN